MPMKPPDRMPMEIPAGSLAPQAVSLFVDGSARISPGVGHLAVIRIVRSLFDRCRVLAAGWSTHQPIALPHQAACGAVNTAASAFGSRGIWLGSGRRVAIALGRGTAAGVARLSAGKLVVVAGLFVGRSVGGIVRRVGLLHALQCCSIGDTAKPWFVQ
jgi:hypothetical protein